MKPTILSALALALAAAALLNSLFQRDGRPRAEPESYELAPAMGDMQRFAEKLYFAGQARNWELAEFYLHEIEETSEEIIAAGVVDEGVAVSSFMKAMLPPSIATAKESLKARDSAQFLSSYEGLLSSCNACHQSAKHGFVKIIVPRQPTYQNQDFSP